MEGIPLKNEKAQAIEAIRFDEMPEPARRLFSSSVELYIRESLPESEMRFTNPIRIQHADSVETYAVDWETPAEYAVRDEEGGIHTFVADVKDGAVIGDGEITYYPGEGHFPFVGRMETREAYRRTGLGERRYLFLNALAKEKYGKPLMAGYKTTEDAAAVWKRFVDQGLAVELVETQTEGDHKYRFI